MATITELRIMMDDPAGASQVFDDTYYQLAVDTESNIFRAGSMIARIFAAHYAAKVDVTAGPVKVKNTQKFEHYKELADKLDNRAKEGGGGSGAVGTGIELTGTSIDTMESLNDDDDRYAGNFRRGLHDNPSNGDSDYDDYNY